MLKGRDMGDHYEKMGNLYRFKTKCCGNEIIGEWFGSDVCKCGTLWVITPTDDFRGTSLIPRPSAVSRPTRKILFKYGCPSCAWEYSSKDQVPLSEAEVQFWDDKPNTSWKCPSCGKAWKVSNGGNNRPPDDTVFWWTDSEHRDTYTIETCRQCSTPSLYVVHFPGFDGCRCMNCGFHYWPQWA